MKFLFYSPVGASAADLLTEVVCRMVDAGGDVLIGIYDDWIPEDLAFYQTRVSIIREPGRRKWQIARRHLPPDTIAEYDYLFLWDDDLNISDFDPARFLSIMKENDLYLAQPSILSPHQITHPITRQKACGVVLESGQRTVGRFTNFVEIMAPVYSKKGWELVYPYLDDENPEAFGYDYIPMGSRGIVDCMHVVHTRPARFKSELPFVHQEKFYKTSGFKTYQTIEMGALTERITIPLVPHSDMGDIAHAQPA